MPLAGFLNPLVEHHTRAGSTQGEAQELGAVGYAFTKSPSDNMGTL
jgi:hypothetical protein